MSKILLIGNTSWSMYNFRKELLKRLADDNHEVYVAAPKDKYSEGIENLGVTFYDLPIDGKSKNPVKELSLLFRIRKLFQTIQPDLVFTYTIKPNIYCSMISKPSQSPVFAITTGLGYVFNHDNFVSKVAKFLYKLGFKKAKQVWFLNPDDQQSFLKKNLVDAKKTKVIPGEGVDTNFFKRNTKYPNQKKYLFLGRLLWDKGFKEYLETAAEVKKIHPESEFLVVGFTGVDNPKAVPEEVVQKNHEEGTINFLGSTDDVRSVLESVDALIFPSFYSEGLPRVLMEASSMEVPIITTDNVGCREAVVDEKTGFLTKPQCAEDLIKQVLKFHQLSDEQKEKMGKLGREFVEEQFSIQKIIDIYTAEIRKFEEE